MAAAVERGLRNNHVQVGRPNGMSMNASATSEGSLLRVVRRGLATAVAITCLAGITRAQTKDCAATVFVLQDLEKEVSVTSPDDRYRVTLSIRTEDDDFGQLRIYAGNDFGAQTISRRRRRR